ncbi:MAG TPA: HD domain-containing protein [Longimicrobiales bacterium]|nr:HD domain-containing protein [Longimicrobiales bacterium]
MREAGRPLGPREWVAGAEFPWPAFDALEAGAAVVACYCVGAISKDRKKDGKPYYKLQLSDRHGPVEARVWDPVVDVMDRLAVGGFVGVRGSVESYKDVRQLKVSDIAPVDVEADDLDLFLPRSPRDAEAMERELAARIAGVADAPLRALLERLLGAGGEIGRAFRKAPAAKHNHHAYVGGLLEHSLSVAGACARMAEHYWPAIDRDLLVTGALLHDLGKIREIGPRAGFPYTDEGKLLGHILLGLQMVADAARELPELPPERLLLLQHLIAAHQGRFEWQSPREPLTLEAVVLHYCDDLDAKLNQALALLASVEAGWSGYDRSLGREFLRHYRPDIAEVVEAAAAPDAAPRRRPPDRAGSEAARMLPAEALAERPPEATPALTTLDLFL